MTQFVFLFPQTAYEQAKEVHDAFSHTFKEITNIMMNYAAFIGQEMWTVRKVITRHTVMTLCVLFSVTKSFRL